MLITYSIMSRQWESFSRMDPAGVCDMEIHYDCLEGEVNLQCMHGSPRLTINNPVLSTAACLVSICGELRTEDYVKYDLNESDQALVFERSAGMVAIRNSYPDWNCRIPFEDLEHAVTGFLVAVLKDVESYAPAMLGNDTVRAIRALVPGYAA